MPGGFYLSNSPNFPSTGNIQGGGIIRVRTDMKFRQLIEGNLGIACAGGIAQKHIIDWPGFVVAWQERKNERLAVGFVEDGGYFIAIRKNAVSPRSGFKNKEIGIFGICNVKISADKVDDFPSIPINIAHINHNAVANTDIRRVVIVDLDQFALPGGFECAFNFQVIAIKILPSDTVVLGPLRELKVLCLFHNKDLL